MDDGISAKVKQNAYPAYPTDVGPALIRQPPGIPIALSASPAILILLGTAVKRIRYERGFWMDNVGPVLGRTEGCGFLFFFCLFGIFQLF